MSTTRTFSVIPETSEKIMEIAKTKYWTQARVIKEAIDRFHKSILKQKAKKEEIK